MFIYRLSIPTIVAQFVAIFTISTFIGLSLLHLSLIWRRIQVGTSSWMIPKRFDVLMYSRKVFNHFAIVVTVNKFWRSLFWRIMLKTRMHSSRMRTARSLTLSRSIRLGGVCPTAPPPPMQTPLDADTAPHADLPGCRPPPTPWTEWQTSFAGGNNSKALKFWWIGEMI